MAHPQRLAELLSGWNVDPQQASAAQAEALAAALRKVQSELHAFARRLSDVAPSSALRSNWLLELLSAQPAIPQQHRPQHPRRGTDAPQPMAHTIHQSAQEMVAERQSSMGELATLQPIRHLQPGQRALAPQAGSHLLSPKGEQQRRVGDAEFQGAIGGAERRQIDALGLGELLKPLEEMIASTRNQEQVIRQKIELDETITIKLEENDNKNADLIAVKVFEAMERKRQAEREAFEDAVRNRDLKDRAKQGHGSRSQS